MTGSLEPTLDLEEASLRLDYQQPLRPGTELYDRSYVERPRVEINNLLAEARLASRQQRVFHWFFTGHTGSGKSTELNRITTEAPFNDQYLPILIDLESELDLSNFEYTDLILLMGKHCANRLEEISGSVPNHIAEAITLWGAEVLSEQTTSTQTEGTAGLSVKIPFLSLGEEVKSGGAKREIIRRTVAMKLVEFIDIVNQLVTLLQEKTSLRVVCVIDGLDHADTEKCLHLFAGHYETLKRPQLSQIIVIPLTLLNSSFLPSIDRSYSTVPNIKVFTKPDSLRVDSSGLHFCKQVIESRGVHRNVFTRDSLRSLFVLSAGIVRDMIRNASNACSYAKTDGKSRVSESHVEMVWNEVVRYYRRQLKTEHYEAIRKVRQTPYLQGIDGIPPLLHSKAIVFYPNGEGWYGVHPAVCRILDTGNAPEHE